MYYILIAAIIVLDQIVKKVVTSCMALGESIPVFSQVFHITYIRNQGAAFSLLEGFRGFLILLPAVLILAALVYIFKKRRTAHPLLLTSLSFIAGGGLGNVIDRAAFGYVVDYLDFRVFPIFNVADIFVCLGCGLLIVYMIFIDGKKEHGKRNSLQSENRERTAGDQN
ncbi:signal peptidase II [Anaerovorax odorimutans]|uniref:Lipoprotein signal peptidase n=1 Tax=Anaerovorax odorimutans TaxID=109327 RepID=A0ABT1RRX2_9FIRM|nr:signal peptidase II [Anaerovorax odorimutans]MCQ4637899.1 signal peptidase II [Anaerovorax odorimutans]